MSELVNFLSTGEHPVRAPRYADADALMKAAANQYVLLRFTDTRGETELGITLDSMRCNLQAAQSVGVVELVGHLVLDFVEVECFAKFDLLKMQGTGGLRVTASQH